MSKKKSSPFVEAVDCIHARLDQMDEAAASRIQLRKSLREIEWNLLKAWNQSPHLAQALGIVKGLRAGLGDETEVKT